MPGFADHLMQDAGSRRHKRREQSAPPHSAFIILPSAFPPLHAFTPAFTLVEVTISVAIAVVLMLGVSEVFRVVGETVGTGQALAVAQRDSRAAQAVMASDFNSAVTDAAPFMLLYSQQEFAFRNLKDAQGSKTGNPNYSDPTGTGTETVQPAAIYNSRSHRIDAFTFFGRGSFARQTGANYDDGASPQIYGSSPFVSGMGGTESMLWYGHLNLADNTGTFTPNTGSGTLAAGNNVPGVGTFTVGQPNYYASANQNNNNYFATNWILGRQQILLQNQTSLGNDNLPILDPPRTSPTSTGPPVYEVVDQTTSPYTSGMPQYAYMQQPQTTVPLSPLAYNSEAFVSAGTTTPLNSINGGTFTLLSSRIDLSATSILGFRNILLTDITPTTTPPYVGDPIWWQKLPTGLSNLRFQAQSFFNPPPSPAPPALPSPKVTPEQLAYQAPIFVRACTQFTVEYAGDYLNQDATDGHVIDTYEHDTGTPPNVTIVPGGSTDGQIDYIPVSGTGQNMIRKIRWYGLPRSTTNNATINGSVNGDSVPLRDIWVTATNGAQGLQAPFEVTLPPLPSTNPPSVDYAPQSTGLAAGAQYICAWGPNDPKPKMIRITMTIDDPGGRLGDGQTYEYIYTLP